MRAGAARDGFCVPFFSELRLLFLTPPPLFMNMRHERNHTHPPFWMPGRASASPFTDACTKIRPLSLLFFRPFRFPFSPAPFLLNSPGATREFLSCFFPQKCPLSSFLCLKPPTSFLTDVQTPFLFRFGILSPFSLFLFSQPPRPPLVHRPCPFCETHFYKSSSLPFCSKVEMCVVSPVF